MNRGEVLGWVVLFAVGCGVMWLADKGRLRMTRAVGETVASGLLVAAVVAGCVGTVVLVVVWIYANVRRS